MHNKGKLWSRCGEDYDYYDWLARAVVLACAWHVAHNNKMKILR